MKTDKMLQVLDGSVLYIKEKHYSNLLRRYTDVEYPIVVNNFSDILNHIDYQSKPIEDILELVTNYLNNISKLS